MANDSIMKWGSPTTVISETGSIAHTYFSTDVTQLDNSSTLYPYAKAVFSNPSGFGSAPTDKSTVDLYMVQDDVDGTSDETSGPNGTDSEAAEYVGSFLIYDDVEAQIRAINISLQGVEKARYFIQNKTDQTISTSVGNPTTVKITPFTYTPSV